METRTILILCTLMLLLIPAIDAKPVIVGFTEEIDQNIIKEHGIANFTQYKIINAISTDIPESVSEKLKKNPKIKYVEEDAQVQIAGKPSQPQPPQPPQQITWGIARIKAPEAWNNSTGINLKIAVLDTGISNNHPDLTVSGGINLAGKSKNNKWNDDNGHGTHVSGIIAARNNSIGVIGVAPDAQLYAVKVLDAYGSGYISDVIEGIDWAVQNNMDIISMSLGTRTYSQALNDTTANAYNAGILLVAAAGNSGDGNLFTDDVLYPAKFDSVIAVSAVDYNNIAPVWSADGAKIELAAPGVDIYSTWLNGGYANESGTSMAAPFLSGAAALIKSKNLSMTPQEIRQSLDYNAIDLGDIGRDNIYGFGLVQAG
ncbi:S8 family peptidase [Candidatus Methanoperedens nitratireducens]|uniref:Subtilisin E n=1 Tax=Candidatus Methanoperedens nitratireducens TaxID=1392998 RepID=A0A284VME1_9EURY|nr:S8 family peptidase [Candidatus Methanoperedens nitroreducens]SNQ60367.1 Subtilisin E [Candidatus Methanoperedens nitroreducens]